MERSYFYRFAPEFADLEHHAPHLAVVQPYAARADGSFLQLEYRGDDVIPVAVARYHLPELTLNSACGVVDESLPSTSQTVNLSPAQRQALWLLGSLTAGRFDLWAMAGGGNAGARARILSILNGHKVPQARAGVHALQDAFYSLAEVPQNECGATQDHHFVRWAQSHVGKVKA